MRLDGELIAVTVSGRDKGRLTPADIMVVDLDGRGVETALRPSAETGLHTQIYRRFPEIGCVLHTHSHNQTVASRLFAKDGHIRLSGYELLKAFRGNATHEMDVDIPVLPNSQDMDALAAQIEPLLDQPNLYGYLIDGHGVYAWGRGPGGSPPTPGRTGIPARLRAGLEETERMSRIRIFNEAQPESPLFESSEHAAIAEQLRAIGVRFERWEAAAPVSRAPRRTK
jgi:methylthioribulose-1-phosphate dehydratase